MLVWVWKAWLGPHLRELQGFKDFRAFWFHFDQDGACTKIISLKLYGWDLRVAKKKVRPLKCLAELTKQGIQLLKTYPDSSFPALIEPLPLDPKYYENILSLCRECNTGVQEW
jgi:hypothetical protein